MFPRVQYLTLMLMHTYETCCGYSTVNKVNAMFYADDSQLYVHLNSSYADSTAQAVHLLNHVVVMLKTVRVGIF